MHLTRTQRKKCLFNYHSLEWLLKIPQWYFHTYKKLNKITVYQFSCLSLVSSRVALCVHTPHCSFSLRKHEEASIKNAFYPTQQGCYNCQSQDLPWNSQQTLISILKFFSPHIHFFRHNTLKYQSSALHSKLWFSLEANSPPWAQRVDFFSFSIVCNFTEKNPDLMMTLLIKKNFISISTFQYTWIARIKTGNSCHIRFYFLCRQQHPLLHYQVWLTQVTLHTSTEVCILVSIWTLGCLHQCCVY